MPATDPLFAQWLMSENLWAVQSSPAITGKWGDTAATTERATTLADRPSAETEANRQLAFLGGPLVTDSHELKGQFAEYLGQVITIFASQLGYEEGLDVFVIGVQDDRATGLSQVTVLRRL